MFIVHIGLHKTATTSLQKDVFPSIEAYDFIGRATGVKLKKQDSLYIDICNFCFSKKAKQNDVPNIKATIKNRLSSKHLILSEEWFTADYSGSHGDNGLQWQEKIKRLALLLSGIEHKILVTLRNPVNGLYSQYCQFTKIKIDKKYKNFESYAKQSNDALVYDYPQLDNYLQSLFDTVVYISFDRLISADKASGLADLFPTTEIRSLGHHNKKTKNQQGVLIVKKNKMVKKTIKLIPIALKTYLRKYGLLAKLKSKVIAGTTRSTIVPKPTSALENELNTLYKDAIVFYEAINNAGKK